MADFDATTAVAVEEQPDPVTQEKAYKRSGDFHPDSAVNAPITYDQMKQFNDTWFKIAMDKNIKANLNHPIETQEWEQIRDNAPDTPLENILETVEAFRAPYVTNVVGFVTKPFGYSPDITRPFGLVKGPIPEETKQYMADLQKEHPGAFTVGNIGGGIVPYVMAAPLFPESLLGMIGTFTTVGVTGEIGRQQTEESLMTPPGERALDITKEAAKSALYAPIWYYSGALKFIGRPWIQQAAGAVGRAGIRGAGTFGLETVFGADLTEAFHQGGMMTALSLIFESPALAKTALGRGIINNANKRAAEMGLPEGQVSINADRLDAWSLKQGIFKLVNGFYRTMQSKVKSAEANPASASQPTPQDRYLIPERPAVAPQDLTNIPMRYSTPRPTERVYTVEDGIIKPTKEMVAEAEAFRTYTIPLQEKADAIKADIIQETGTQIIPGSENTAVEDRAKSAKSLALKVARRIEAGDPNFTLMNIKDAARETIILNNITDIPKVLQSFSTKGDFTLDVKILQPHASGYMGVFANTVDPDTGMGMEFQIQMDQAGWDLKLKTDELYRPFRELASDQIKGAQLEKYKALRSETLKLWQDYYLERTGGSLSALESAIRAAASESGMTVESKNVATGKDVLTQDLVAGENATKLSASTKTPESVMAYLKSFMNVPPPSSTNIPQEGSAVKGKTTDKDIVKVKGTISPPPESRGGVTSPEADFSAWKDKPKFSLHRETMERNLEAVAGGDAKKMKEFLIDHVRANETARATWLTLNRQMIREKMDALKIKMGSKESALVMRYGEKRMTLDELKKESPKKWQQISEASEFFRNLYDEYLENINAVRAKFGYDPIPKRADYFRHYQEMGLVTDILGLVTNADKIPTTISGLTAFFKPGKPFTNAELQRLGGAFTEDAIGAMDNYLDSVGRQLFHIDSVQRARAIEKYIRQQAEENPAVHLPNFVSNMMEYGNLLAGKKAMSDRAMEDEFGRGVYKNLNKMRSRIGANMIAGNISSAMMNFIPFTQSMATTGKKAAGQGLLKSIMTPFDTTKFAIDGVESALYTRRYPLKAIDLNFWGKTSEFMSALFDKVDRFTVKAILAGKYYEGIEKGMSPEAAMNAADVYTARLVQDRSWGSLPNLMGRRTLGFITQFQTEVNNMASWVMKDIPRMHQGNAKKIINAYMQFILLSFLFNEIYERIMGRRPTIDPIYAIGTLMGLTKSGKGQTGGERTMRAAADFIGNLPFGNLLIQGGRFPISAGIPDVKKILTAKHAETKIEELKKPLFYFLFPGGGGQVKKTIEGLYDYARGKSTTAVGTYQHPVEQNLLNFMRAVAFGKTSFPEHVDYSAKKGRQGAGMSGGSRGIYK